MIEIRNAAGQLAELYPNTQITVEKNNPLFNEQDKLFEDITYPFKMPESDINKIFFSSGHLVEADNSIYELEVSCIVSGYSFFAGTLTFSFVNGEFETLLKVNFGALASKLKKVKMKEIFTQDALPSLYTAAYMKTVCQNPDQYPYSFFPVYNEKWDLYNYTTHFTINNWNHDTQEFSLISFNNRDYTLQVPFFKLKYTLVKLMEVLGFTASGSFVDDPEMDKIYIYNRINAYGPNKLYDCFVYLPAKITPADFIKIIKERFKITITPDIIKGIVKIESASSILSNPNVLDLTEYLPAVEEIAIPETEGYTITLKPDSDDALWIDPNQSQNKYVATNQLIVGDGGKTVELAASTLKSKTVSDYQMPTAKQNFSSAQLEFQLRFLKYSGMKAVAGGKFFPQAEPLELSEADGKWWRFLNDSKKVKLTFYMPVAVLHNLQSTQRIGFKSKEGTYAEALCEKIIYNLKHNDEEYIQTTIEARTIVASYTTPITVRPINTVLDATKSNYTIRAFLNTAQTGLNNLIVSMYYTDDRVEIYSALTYVPITHYATIETSTDKYGVGGVGVNMPLVPPTVNTLTELRVFSGTVVPKYAILNGQKGLFTLRDGYYYNSTLFTNQGNPVGDGRGIWIVF